MSFKELVASDISKVFLNPSEFADLHTIDGREITAVVDESVNDKNPLYNEEGVFVVRKTLFISLEELGYKPDESQWLNLDGFKMQAVHVADDAGMLTIRLEANVT